MAKRGSIIENMRVAKPGEKTAPPAKATEAPADVETITTGINMPQDLHALLRAVALKRAKERGGRPSVSAILVELARDREDEFREEAGRYLELLDLF